MIYFILNIHYFSIFYILLENYSGFYFKNITIDGEVIYTIIILNLHQTYLN